MSIVPADCPVPDVPPTVSVVFDSSGSVTVIYAVTAPPSVLRLAVPEPVLSVPDVNGTG